MQHHFFDSKCNGRPYQFNPKFSAPRMITPAQAKAMLDADTAQKVVLAAVPFWPTGGKYWWQLDPTDNLVGPTPAHTDYNSYIQYVTGSRTYQSIQFDWRIDLADVTLPLRYYDLPSKDVFQQTLRNKNITKNHTIILYDDTVAPGGAISATNNAVNRLAVRALFVLQYFGHDNVYFINGGDQEWFKAAIPGTSVNPTAAPTACPAPPVGHEYTIATERNHPVISRDGVVEERLNPCSVLLDARPYKMYVGTLQGSLVQCASLDKVRRLGHIKGAVNAQWADYLEIVDGTPGVKYTRFKSAAALSDIMISNKVLVENKKVVTICNEGIHAVMAWFVINHIFDYSNVTVYEGSTAEWADGAFVFEAGAPAGVLIPQGIERYPMLSGLEDL